MYKTRSYFRARPHVWHQQRKVTPFAGSSTRYHYWTRWTHPQEAADRHHAAVIARCLHESVTVAAPARLVRRASRVAPGFHVRQVDDHGSTYGPRLLVVDHKATISALGYDLTLVERPNGQRFHLAHDARVRLVVRQAEDPHSIACRALKAQWRMTRNDRSE